MATCQIIATRGAKRPIRTTGDPSSPYLAALRAAGWTVTTTPLPAPNDPFCSIPTPSVEAI
jgi:hypothetical protein